MSAAVQSLKFVKSVFSFGKTVITEFFDDECMEMAASLAFYVAFSLIPILIIVMAIAGVFFSPDDIHGEIASQADEVMGEDGADQVKKLLHNAQQWEAGGLEGIVSIAALIFGASGVVVQCRDHSITPGALRLIRIEGASGTS